MPIISSQEQDPKQEINDKLDFTLTEARDNLDIKQKIAFSPRVDM